MTHVDGLQQLTRLSSRLRGAATRDLRLELNRALRESTKALPEAIRKNASQVLPKRGGLAADVAASRISISRRNTGSAAGVRVVTKNAYIIGRMDRGKLRHRVYGGDVWVAQAVPPGWWSDPIRADMPRVKSEMEAACDRIGEKIGAPL